MKGIDRLECQGRIELTDIWIVFFPLEIDTSGVFRKGPCRKTRHDGPTCPGPPERRSGLHAKNVKPRAFQDPEPVYRALCALGTCALGDADSTTAAKGMGAAEALSSVRGMGVDKVAEAARALAHVLGLPS